MKKFKKYLFIGVRYLKCHGFVSYYFVPNKNMSFGGKQSMFELAHIFWWVYWI